MNISYIKICQSRGKDIQGDYEPKSFHRKPKSDATKLKEQLEFRTERRSNICPSCFTAKAQNGSCSC